MKKLVLFLVAAFASLTFTSCLDDNEPDSTYEFIPVQSVTVPTAFKVDSISVFKVKYFRPTDCYLFDGFYYNVEGYTRTVAINAVRFGQDNCQPDQTLFEVPLNFKPQVPGTYQFKFWLGENEGGVDEYYTCDVVVEE